MIRETGGEVEADGDQRCVPALPFVAGNVLDRHACRLADELRHAGLVDGVAARRLDADGAHILQAFNQAEHRGGLCRFRHLPQPGQLVLATTVAAAREGIEPAALLGRQAVGQAPMHVAARLMAQLGAEPLQCGGRRHDNPPLAARPHHERGEMREAVILDRLRQQGGRQFRRRALAERTKPETLLTFDRMTLPIAFLPQIAVDGIPGNVDLLCDKREQRVRRAPRIAQVAKHQRLTETIVVATTTSVRRQIGVREREVAHELAAFRGRIIQLRDLRLAQPLSSCHSCLLALDAGRPADPGQGVDQRAALDAEAAADRGLGRAGIERAGDARQFFGIDHGGTAAASCRWIP